MRTHISSTVMPRARTGNDAEYSLTKRHCGVSRRQQLLELSGLVRLAFAVGDHDLPAFAREDLCLESDHQAALTFDLDRLVLAFCDHLVRQLPASLVFSSIPRCPGLERWPLAAICRPRGDLVKRICCCVRATKKRPQGRSFVVDGPRSIGIVGVSAVGSVRRSRTDGNAGTYHDGTRLNSDICAIR